VANQEGVMRSEGKGHLPGPSDFREAQQLIEHFFDTSLLGVAILSDELRFLAINNALAAINGIPALDHLGRTLGEVLGGAARVVEPVMNRVLTTGKSALNIEITAELPTRTEEGNWIANYVPIKDAAGKVKKIAALVLEMTKSKKFERCLLRLMENLPRIRDQVICLGLRNRAEPDWEESWDGSVGLLERCVLDIRSYSRMIEPFGRRMSDIAALRYQAQIALPFGTAKPPKENSEQPDSRPNGNRGSSDVSARQNQAQFDLPYAETRPVKENHEKRSDSGANGSNGAAHLSPREFEIMLLLAAGKSNKEIAIDLPITVKTVESYRAKIMLKLDLHSMNELVRYAVRHKMIDT
jgi:DNA-binding CsgD family transcriptional regulator/PAS domain-containing protein